LEFLSRTIKQEAEIKDDDMILYLKDKKKEKLHPKTPRHHKQLQQSSRIQNQLTTCLSMHQQ
jgi:hypothetical protein